MTKSRTDQIIEAIEGVEVERLSALMGKNKRRARMIRCGEDRKRPADVIVERIFTGQLSAEEAFDLMSAGIPEVHQRKATLAALRIMGWEQDPQDVARFIDLLNSRFDEDKLSDLHWRAPERELNLASQALGWCFQLWDYGKGQKRYLRRNTEVCKSQRRHVKFLLGVGADPMDMFHAGHFTGWRSLMYMAGGFGDEEIVRELLHFKGRVTQKRLVHLFLSSFPMAKLDAAGVDLKWVLKPMRRVNTRMDVEQIYAGRWPFGFYYGRGEVTPASIRKLAQHGVDFNVRNPKYKYVPLSLVLQKPDVMQSMINHGADVSMLNIANLLENAKDLMLPKRTVAILKQYKEMKR